MGFRSTFTTEDYGIVWPDWFRDKYKNSIWFKEKGDGCLQSRYEAKTYGLWERLPEDIQAAINWESFAVKNFIVLFLHECGGISRCQIEKSAIRWSEPTSWQEVGGVTHNYCYGCSDVEERA